jgi:tRNA threonylcarbamoyladenosine biosynthesis protein TsaE
MLLKPKNNQLLVEYYAPTVRQTAGLARKLAKNWQGGQIVALSGELGAGKTSFVQSVAKYLKIAQPLVSPTFTIWQEYACQHPTIKKLLHIDAYRLSSGQDLLAIGIDDWVKRADCLIIIEWPEIVADWLPKQTKVINLQHQPPGRLISWLEPRI